MNSYEFFRNLRDYENKYGKLGQSKSILHEDNEPVQIKRNPNELKHSYESDYFEFRRKVQAGRERYSKVHARTISPDELNARYHEDLINNGVLIHSDWGKKYYEKIDLPGGGSRYFYSRDEYEAYLEEKTKQQNAAKEANKQVQGASSDNARGAGNDYQRWLDQQKAGVKETGAKLENNNLKNMQKLTSDNNTSSANKATSNASSANKATTNYATTSQVQSQQVKDNYNKNVNQSLSANTSSADNARGQGTEYQEYLKKKKEEEEREKARKQTEMYNKNAEAAKNAAADRGFKESDNEEIERTVRNKRDEYKKIMGSNDKSAKAFEEDFMKQKGIKNEDDAKKYGLIKLVNELNDAYDEEIEKINKRNAEEAEKRAEISRKNDQGRDAAIKNSNKGSNYGSSIEEQKRKEELARKNSQGRDAAISNSNKKTEGEDMADAARKTLKGTHDRSLGKTNDSLKNADVKRANDAAALRKREAEREETESNGANAQTNIKSTKGYDKELSPIDLDIERNEAAFTDKDNMGEKKRREEIARKNDQGRNSAISNSNKKTEGERMSDTARSTLEKTHDASRAKTNDISRYQAQNAGNKTISENRQENMLKDITAKGADPEAIANKYGVSEEYVRELAYNAAGLIFENKLKENVLKENKLKEKKLKENIKHSAFSSPYEFYSNLEEYKEKCALKHSSPLKGEQKFNVKYYKRIGAPGNYRYFYTKDEWDTYNDQMISKNAQAAKNAAADRGFRESNNSEELRRSYETSRKNYDDSKKVWDSIKDFGAKTGKEIEQEYLKSKGLTTEEEGKKYGIVKIYNEIKELIREEEIKNNEKYQNMLLDAENKIVTDLRNNVIDKLYKNSEDRSEIWDRILDLIDRKIKSDSSDYSKWLTAICNYGTDKLYNELSNDIYEEYNKTKK